MRPCRSLRVSTTARRRWHFVSLLPLALEDYASIEKMADRPRKLSTKGAPPGTAAAPGDFSYYAPWGNRALFYEPFRCSDGLVRRGTIESGIEPLRRAGPLHVRIRLSEDEGRCRVRE